MSLRCLLSPVLLNKKLVGFTSGNATPLGLELADLSLFFSDRHFKAVGTPYDEVCQGLRLNALDQPHLLGI